MRKIYQSSIKKFTFFVFTFLIASASVFGQTRDIGVVAMESPLAPHTGLAKAVQVRVRNFGTTPVVTFKVGYTINGVVQADVVGAAIPAPTTANPAPTTLVTLPNIIDTNNIKFVFYTKDANNLGDDDKFSNDTLKAYTAPPISGIKYIGGLPTIPASDYYATITDAVNALRYCGIDGNITFKIRPGTYFDNIGLPAVHTTAAANKIVFETSSGNKDVLLISDPGVISTIKLDGTDNVTIRRIKIFNRNIINGIGIQMLNGANGILIENCEISVDSISNTKGFAGIAAVTMATVSPFALSNVSSTKNTIIRNNSISGGYYGILLNGAAAPLDSTNIIEQNIIKETSFYGLYIVNNANIKVKKNKVYFRASADQLSTGYHFQALRSTVQFKNEIMDNYVTGAGTNGMYFNNVEGNAALYTLVANNMIAGGFFSNNGSVAPNIPTGISINACGFVNIYRNSVNLEPPITVNDLSRALYISGGASGKPIKIINNILRNNGKGYAYYNASATGSNPVTSFDFNDLVVSSLDTAAGPARGFAFYGTERTSLTALRTTAPFGSGTHCFSIEPKFFSDFDLHTVESTLDGKGTPTGMAAETPQDYDGDNRDENLPDPGADDIRNGLDDWAIVGITPEVFKKGVNKWNIVVKWNGTTVIPAGQILAFTAWVNGALLTTGGAKAFCQIPHAVNPGQTVTLPAEPCTAPRSWDITRTTYDCFKLKVTMAIRPGQTDNRPSNDTYETDVCVGLAGNYYIQAPGTPVPCVPPAPGDSTFTSITEAFQYLKAGVSGPTTLYLCPGVYDEQVALWRVRNSSAQNTITIDSKESLLNTRLTFFGGTPENNATVILNNAQFFIIKDLTIENRNAANGLAMQIAGNSRFNTITECAIRVDSTLSPYPTTLFPMMFSKLGTLTGYGRNSQFNNIFNNKISGGYNGIAIYGQDTNLRDRGNFLKGNLITGFNRYGVYVENADVNIHQNYIVGKIGMDVAGGGMYIKNSGDDVGSTVTISSNRINDVTLNGIKLDFCRSAKIPGSAFNTFVVQNNMIGGGFAYTSSTVAGIGLNLCSKISIVHNTINMDASRSSSNNPVVANVPRAMIVDVTNNDIEAFNNIFYSPSGAIALEYYTKLTTANPTAKNGLILSDNNEFYTTYSNKKTPLVLIYRRSDLTGSNSGTMYSFYPGLSQSPTSALTKFQTEKLTITGPGGGVKEFNKTRERASLAVPVVFEELPYNLHTNTPKLNGVGKNLKILTDYDGELRPNRPDIGADEFSNPPTDLAIQKIYNQVISSVRPNYLKIQLRNKGTKSLLDSVILEYKVSSSAGVVVASSSEKVRLRMKNINDLQPHSFAVPFSVPKGTYSICVKLKDGELPADTVPGNNSLCIGSCTGIEGDFFIGYSSMLPGHSDPTRYFTTIQGAFNGVECGIAGPTFFYLNPAVSPYQERITIPKYAVSVDSPILTLLPYQITDSTVVTLQQPASGGDADKLNYVVRFQGSQFVRLKYLTIHNTNPAFGVGVNFTRNAQYNIIERCLLKVNNTSASPLFYPVVFSSSLKSDITNPTSNAKSGSYNRLLQNTIVGGYAGVGFAGASLGSLDYGNSVDSNTIIDFYQYGIFSKYHTIGSVSFNTIEPRATGSASAVTISYWGGSENGRINANILKNTKSIAIRVFEVEAFNDEKLVISNNWITSGFSTAAHDSAAAITVKKSSNIGVYYNSIRYDGLGKAFLFTDDSVSVPDPEGGPNIINRIYVDVKAYNNIVHKYSTSANPAYLIYMNSVNPFSEIDHNDFYNNHPKFGYYYPNDQDDWGEWSINTRGCPALSRP